jgi:uncharacterized protein
MSEFITPFYGGILIGTAALLMLLANGRVLGVSGIVGGILSSSTRKQSWRLYFTGGLLAGGLLESFGNPSVFAFTLSRSWVAIVVAGLLVGYGARLGNGCTSGHGICGVSRLSRRSILATILFIATGAAVVFIINHLLGGQI